MISTDRCRCRLADDHWRPRRWYRTMRAHKSARGLVAVCFVVVADQVFPGRRALSNQWRIRWIHAVEIIHFPGPRFTPLVQSYLQGGPVYCVVASLHNEILNIGPETRRIHIVTVHCRGVIEGIGPPRGGGHLGCLVGSPHPSSAGNECAQGTSLVSVRDIARTTPTRG